MSFRHKGTWLIVVVCSALVWSGLSGQELQDSPGQELTWDFIEEGAEFSITDLLTPQSVREAERIRSYVRDPRFEALRHRDGDLRAADAIYLRSLRIAGYDIAQALFLSLLATLEHRRMPLRLPVFGVISLPLTFEDEGLFLERIKHLPRSLYPDSPSDGDGDRDKLQHFFGSATLAYATTSPSVARAAGEFIEWGEALMVPGGVDDPRDHRSNMQGEMFGHDLVYVQTMLPSDYLRLRLQVPY